MAHPLRLQRFLDAEVIQPGAVTVPQAVRCEAAANRQPAGDRRLLRRAAGPGADSIAELVAYQRAVHPEQA